MQHIYRLEITDYDDTGMINESHTYFNGESKLFKHIEELIADNNISKDANSLYRLLIYRVITIKLSSDRYSEMRIREVEII